MLKILKKKSIDKVLIALKLDTLYNLEYIYHNSIDDEEKLEYTFFDFFSDLVQNVIFRIIDDGNWEEFANRFNVTEVDYNEIKAIIISLGWNKTLTEW